MRTIDLNTQLIDFTEDNRKYLILGSDKMEDSIYVQESVVPRIKKTKKDLIGIRISKYTINHIQEKL